MPGTTSRAPIGVIASFRYAFSSPQRLRTEILAGLVVGLALIPEAISFSVLAGVDPAVGLWSSVVMAIVIAFTGGRPGMITAATGAIALVIAPVALEYGLQYFLATILLGGILQIILALVGVAKLMRFIPQSVMTGFVNGLGIMLFTAQLPHMIDVPTMVYLLIVVGLIIVFFFPKLTDVVPAPLIAILVLTLLVVIFRWDVPDVADQGEIPNTLPQLVFPDVPWNLETLQIIFPYALGVAIVGLMESLMTAQLVDDITDTRSPKTRESWGQGVANICSSLFGGMGGCAMIGQTMINVNSSGARTRLSTMLAGVFLFILIAVFGDWVGMIPMAALVAVMIMVSYSTIDWHSIKPATLKVMPKSETLIMAITVIATLGTGNLAIGVVLGVVAAMMAFATNTSRIASVEKIDLGHYVVRGPLFFASTNELQYRFNYHTEAEHIVIDFSDANVLDASAVTVLDSIQHKFQENNKSVEYRGLRDSSRAVLDRLSGL